VLNQGLGQILVLLVFLVTARFVSKEAFGIMAASLIAIELFRQIFIEPIGTTFYAKNSPTADDYNAGFFIILFGGACSAIFIFAFAGVIASVLENGEIERALSWISLLLLTTGLSKMHEIWLSKHFKFKSLAIRSLCSIVIGGAVGIYMAVEGYGINSLIAQQVISASISLCWLWMACDWRPSLPVRLKNVLEIISSAKYVVLNSVVSTVSNQADVLLSTYYLGAGATGTYSAAKRLLTASALIIASGLNNVALPAQAAISKDLVRFRKSFLKCVGFTSALTAPIFVGMAVLSADLVYVLMGENWLDAAPILTILAAVGFNRSVAQYSSNVLLIQGKARLLTAIGIFKAVVSIMVLVIFAKYGLSALALAYVGRTLLLSPITTRIALRLLGISSYDYLRTITPPILVALLMGTAIFAGRLYFDFHPLLNLVFFVPVGGAIYVSMLWLIDKQTLRESVEVISKSLKKV